MIRGLGKFVGLIEKDVRQGKVVMSKWGTVGPYQIAGGNSEPLFAFFDDVSKRVYTSTSAGVLAWRWHRLNCAQMFGR